MEEKYNLEFLKEFIAKEKENVYGSFFDIQDKLSDALCDCSYAIEKEYKKLKEYRDNVLKRIFTTRVEIQKILESKVTVDEKYLKVMVKYTDTKAKIDIRFIESPTYDLEHIFNQIKEYKRFILALKIETAKYVKNLIDLFSDEENNKIIKSLEEVYHDKQQSEIKS
jgi:CHAD domain-containing protein